MVAPVFSGVGVALVTLFDDSGDVDAPATADLASRLVEAGVHAVVVAGTTGEAASLAPEERIRLVEAVRAAVPADVPVVAGTGAPSARQAASLTRDAVDHGADALLVLSPPGAADPRPYYEAVASVAAGRVLLAYHYPKVSAPGIDVAVLPDLPVAGIKDSTGDPERLLEELEVWDRPVYTGSSAVLSFAGPLGCAGAILALANAEPERCVRALAGDPSAQRELTATHLAAKRRFPGGLKELVARRFGTSCACRMG
ncbi:MAG: dihydrodipicolinate synthase family protein [Acidimicrobiia bacterium]|nr:dihydrodipicolinate synthase family protein [Acidimicrobiia bacterium]